MNLFGQPSNLAEQANANLYAMFISNDNGQTFIPPYGPGTTQMFNYSDAVYMVNEDVQEMLLDTRFTEDQLIAHAAFSATLLDEDQAAAAGWFN